MNKRLDGDIFSKNPTVLMVTFGMNDSGYYEYNGDNAKEFGEQKYQESIKNFQQMEKRLFISYAVSPPIPPLNTRIGIFGKRVM